MPLSVLKESMLNLFALQKLRIILLTGPFTSSQTIRLATPQEPSTLDLPNTQQISSKDTTSPSSMSTEKTLKTSIEQYLWQSAIRLNSRKMLCWTSSATENLGTMNLTSLSSPSLRCIMQSEKFISPILSNTLKNYKKKGW